MIELFIGCSLLLQVEITEQSIDDYFLCNHLQDVKQWYYKTEKHFGDDTLFALAVMSCESDGRAKATGYNTDGSIYNKELDMYDVETNIKAARWLSFYDGWHHWNSSKHCWGRYARTS